VTADKVLINARFTDPSGSTVLSAYDYAVPMDRTLFGLINGCYQEGRWICPLP